MVKIAIVDDEKECSDALGRFLRRYFSSVGREYSLTVYGDGMDFISSYKRAFDIVFMDIRMKCMNGLDAAHELRKMDGSVVLVFVTEMMQYAIKGYDVGAFDFIVKPVDYYSFAMKMDRIMNELSHRRDIRIMVTQYNSCKVLMSSEIYYVEVLGHNVIYHTSQGEVKARGTLAEIQSRLDGAHFFLCHRCYLVNAAYVDGIGENTVTVHGEEVPLSRLKKKEFFNTLANYLGRNT